MPKQASGGITPPQGNFVVWNMQIGGPELGESGALASSLGRSTTAPSTAAGAAHCAVPLITLQDRPGLQVPLAKHGPSSSPCLRPAEAPRPGASSPTHAARSEAPASTAPRVEKKSFPIIMGSHATGYGARLGARSEAHVRSTSCTLGVHLEVRERSRHLGLEILLSVASTSYARAAPSRLLAGGARGASAVHQEKRFVFVLEASGRAGAAGAVPRTVWTRSDLVLSSGSEKRPQRAAQE